jgi:DNA replication protein DnaC
LLIRTWVEPSLLIFDDLFLARRISDADGRVAAKHCTHRRYKQRRSIVITSNRVVLDWGKYLGDVTTATTILDRMMHRCRLLEFEGKGYRRIEASTSHSGSEQQPDSSKSWVKSCVQDQMAIQ